MFCRVVNAIGRLRRSSAGPQRPVLRFNDLTHESNQNERGFMSLFMGTVFAIRVLMR